MCYLGLETLLVSKLVNFHVERNNTWNIHKRLQTLHTQSETFLSFNTVVADNEHSMNIVSGIFTTPVSGVYLFVFQGKGSRPTYATLMKNEADIISSSAEAGEYLSFTTGLLFLRLGDTIRIRLSDHGPFYKYMEEATFTGILFRAFP